MITLHFEPWHPFLARKNSGEIQRWLKAIGDASVEAFRSGMGTGPGHSAPGDWPNFQTGRLNRSIRSEVRGDSELVVGSNAHSDTGYPYSAALRWGTERMDPRKMSPEALQEGMKNAPRLGLWVEWTRV